MGCVMMEDVGADLMMADLEYRTYSGRPRGSPRSKRAPLCVLFAGDLSLPPFERQSCWWGPLLQVLSNCTICTYRLTRPGRRPVNDTADTDRHSDQARSGYSV